MTTGCEIGNDRQVHGTGELSSGHTACGLFTLELVACCFLPSFLPPLPAQITTRATGGRSERHLNGRAGRRTDCGVAAVSNLEPAECIYIVGSERARKEIGVRSLACSLTSRSRTRRYAHYRQRAAVAVEDVGAAPDPCSQRGDRRRSPVQQNTT